MPTRRVDFGLVSCYDLTEGLDGLEIADLVTGDLYGVRLDGDVARIACPDATEEVVPVASVERFFVARPETDQCDAAEPEVSCAQDSDCAEFGDDSVCCDIGTRVECLPALACCCLLSIRHSSALL